MALTLDVAPGHVPFEVRADLQTGAGWDLPYGLDLAGMIAAHLRRVEKQQRETEGTLVTSPMKDTTEEVVYDLALPLSRCTTGTDWHWAATCAIPVAPQEDPEPRTLYRVTDSAWSERAANRPLPYFSPKAGPYRDVMMSAPIITCSAIVWRGIGDVAAVHAAVRPIRSIGRRRSVGEGKVLRWTVREVAPDDPGRYVHAEGLDILRPCPTECADALTIPHRVGLYAIRPPSWHPDRLSELAMTDDADDDSWFD